MNLTPEIIEAIFTGLIIGLGVAIYRVYQYQTQDSNHKLSTDSLSGNGFRVAMESVKEAHQTSVELLHEQIDHMEAHLDKLELTNAHQTEIIDRLEELLLARGVFVDEQGRVVAQYKPDNEMATSS